jgi:pSer/pThr/pTyr-binding forkhead associated (FHA) protein
MKVNVQVSGGPLKDKEFAFTGSATVVFGRASDCQCCLSGDPYVSRHHFKLEIDPPHCRLRDLGSRNGTFVNGTKYGGRNEKFKADEAPQDVAVIDLKDGDTIKVGQTQLHVFLELTEPVAVSVKCSKCGKPIEPPNADGALVCQECQRKEQASAYASEENVRSPEINDDFLDEVINQVYDETKQGLPSIPGYVVVLKLGQGGFGTVYFAKRQSDGKEVALKLLQPQKKSITERDIRHFQREMKVTMNLKHPNLVTFEEQGYSGGLLYFAMEYCSGGSLQDFLDKKGVLNPSEALPIMLQALEGLSYAHNKGFVHRDLKPGNILFSDRTRKLAKISDFGMAKNFQLAGLSGFTASGESAGTLQFMPKEQLLDYKHFKPVSDVFSMGATFYYMLTSRFVYDFENVADPERAILGDKIVPLSKRRVVPKNLASVIEKALSPEPENRYQTAAEMRTALCQLK